MIVENLPEKESLESPPAVEPVNETLLDNTETLPAVVDLVKETLPDVRLEDDSTDNQWSLLEDDSTDNQSDNEVENRIPTMNPVEVDSVRDGDTFEVENCRSKCAKKTVPPELLAPMRGNVLEFSGLSDTVTEETQSNDTISPAQDVTTDECDPLCNVNRTTCESFLDCLNSSRVLIGGVGLASRPFIESFDFPCERETETELER
ncbi:unnamed protein product [Leuciscus chuanchicus]